VKDGGAFGIPRGKMPMEMIRFIIDYWGQFPEMKVIAPFMNGEPMLDERLPEIFDYTVEKAPHAYNLIATNGNIWANRENLVHPNLRIVRFTISANTPETYERVHGVDLFSDAIKTVEWFKENRFVNQRIEFHFIVTKNNENEIEPWIERYQGFMRKVFPLHRMDGIQEDSELSLGANTEYIIKTDTLENWKKTRPLQIYPDGVRRRARLDKRTTCQGMSFAVNWDGRIIHCTDAPPEYDYGHVYEKDMLDAWKERNIARINNPACIACNSKRPDWKEILEKYILSEIELEQKNAH
jgi:MoaA/NifB/PqqE/SkfB family radical SAM enzyme